MRLLSLILPDEYVFPDFRRLFAGNGILRSQRNCRPSGVELDASSARPCRIPADRVKAEVRCRNPNGEMSKRQHVSGHGS